MRGNSSFLVLLPLVLFFSATQALSQSEKTPSAGGAAEIGAQYAAAAQARDWSRATALAKQLAALSPSAENLRLMGNAQMSSGSNEEALATFAQALTAAAAEKPAPRLKSRYGAEPVMLST